MYALVRQIPKGMVATYGQIAWALGSPKAARAVGTALHHNPDPDLTPCYRVVNRLGQLSTACVFGGEDWQRGCLEAEGVVVVDGAVALGRYQVRDLTERLEDE